jgi:hypothetical protein
MRSITPSFVVAPPTGAKIRTRLLLPSADQQVLMAVGQHLGILAGRDLVWRCQLGLVPDQRTERKRALTDSSSSR